MGGSFFLIDKIPCLDSFHLLGISNLEKSRRQDRNTDMSKDLPEQGLNIIQLKKQNPKADHSIVLFTAVAALGKIGSSKSGEFLAKVKKGKSDLAEEARKALDTIKLRKKSPKEKPSVQS